MQILTKDFKVPEEIIHYLPLILKETQERTPELPAFEERRNFCSIGNFLHEPNWDAVLQLKEKIWPLIRKALPETELHIYGAYPSQKVFQLHDEQSGFLIKGRATSAGRVLREARILLAPLRFGAGIKGKFLDAMEAGTPSVTTRVGAEAMKAGLEWSGSIEDDPEAFARAAVFLYQNKKKWQESHNNGFRILKENFPAETYSRNFRDRILDLQERLSDHREKNFTGAMLMQHRVNASRYLSKYIQMKNRTST